MLVLSRKLGEVILIGDDVEVRVVGFRGNKVRLGIKAPRKVQVLREEIVDRAPGDELRRPWIVAHDGTQGELAYALECRRCGAIQRVVIPISIDGYVALARVFERQHSRCRPRVNPIQAAEAERGFEEVR